jgi:uncharacterized phage protein gp47/JayE
MTLQFTVDGVTVDTLTEVFNRLAQEYRDIYGQDINLDPDSPDGQRVGIEAKAIADVQAFALALYNSLDPDLARGVGLDRIIKFCGITRRPATRSTWDIVVTTSQALTLDAGYAILDDLGQEWFLLQSADLVAGANTVTFRARDFGAVENTAGAQLEQATVVLGVSSLQALVDPTVGVSEETDGELRQRRNRSLQNPSYSTTGGLYARLANTAGVLDAQVYEDDTDTYDAVRDIEAHTVWAIVEGGTVEDIAETIAKNKTGGTRLKGDVTQVYSETRIRPDGSTFVVPHTMRFDRPTDVPLYINVTATRKNPSDPVDVALIALRLAAFDFYIGDDAVASELYDPAYGGDGEPNFYLTDLRISDDDSTYTAGRLTSALDGKFSISSANVTVTEVTPP